MGGMTGSAVSTGPCETGGDTGGATGGDSGGGTAAPSLDVPGAGAVWSTTGVGCTAEGSSAASPGFWGAGCATAPSLGASGAAGVSSITGLGCTTGGVGTPAAGSGAPCLWPQAKQNLAPGLHTAWHWAQRKDAGAESVAVAGAGDWAVPQPLQNLADGARFWPQWEQFIGTGDSKNRAMERNFFANLTILCRVNLYSFDLQVFHLRRGSYIGGNFLGANFAFIFIAACAAVES